MSHLEEWKSARGAFLALPAGSPDARAALDRLANAEDALYRSTLETTPAPVSEHPDDLAVDKFAAAMKAKLAIKRGEGRGGWENKNDCSAEFLSTLLRNHIEKGDPLDVGNLAMMLHQRGDAITPAPVSEITEEMVERAALAIRQLVWGDATTVIEPFKTYARAALTAAMGGK